MVVVVAVVVKIRLLERRYLEWRWRYRSVDPMPKYGKSGGFFVTFGPFLLRWSDW